MRARGEVPRSSRARSCGGGSGLARGVSGWSLALVLICAAGGCGTESSLTDAGGVPYHLQAVLVDPSSGEALETSGDVATWSLGRASGPSLEVTYWADRNSPAIPLIVRGMGASVAGAETDPWAETPPADSQASIALAMIDEVHRTVRVGIIPPSAPGRAVLSAVLGGIGASISVDFVAPDATVSVDPGANRPADGTTEVAVTVAGTAREVVTIETTLGTFVAPFFDVTATVTLLPVSADSTEGSATVGLVSDAPGPAIVSVSGSASEWIRVDFDPVRLDVGSPVPSDMDPGLVVHDVCVALNTTRGAISLSGASYDATVLEPSSVAVVEAGAGLPDSCPPGSHAGYALFGWAGDGVSDVLTASWESPDGAVSVSSSVRVTAERFLGYDGLLSSFALGTGDPYHLVLDAELTYLPVGSLAGIPAAGVPVTFLVFSDFGATKISSDLATGPDGVATAVYELEADDTLQVFVRPEGGSTLYLGTAPW